MREAANNRVIDLEHETEIWAEEIESDFDCDYEEGYDASLLDLDVQTISGKSSPLENQSNVSIL